MKTITDLRQLTIAAGFGALMFAIGFAISTPIQLITGTPGTGGLVSGIILIILLVIGDRILQRFGYGTVSATTMAILSIPTVLFGAPGIYKVAVGFAGGLLWDASLLFLKRNRVGYTIAAIAAGTAILISMLLMLAALGLPGDEKMKQIFLIMWIVDAIIVVIGVQIALLLYEKKIKNLKVVRQLQSSN
ncbi:hypothetical protein HYV82_05785 [Candidatus Woesearchaeota archaeon]|nr:hypothetical protein [Candidatus Woesearchaeota archaeon]